jgi:hypothetical protein
VVDEDNKNCDNGEEVIEQGTDLLDPSVDLAEMEADRTGGREEKQEAASEESMSKLDDGQSELLEKWMKNGTSSECCSNDGSLVQTCEKFAEISVSAVQTLDSPLMARTDALLNTKSFNLVKPKPNL